MKKVLEAFSQYLEERHLRLEVTVIGGAALILLGVIDRATLDVDCLDPVTHTRTVGSAGNQAICLL